MSRTKSISCLDREPMGRKGLIRFRCWYCNRRHVAGWDQVGVRRVCHCGERYRVPRNPGDIAWRDKSFLEWLRGVVLYGFGGAFLSSLLLLAVVTPVRLLLQVDLSFDSGMLVVCLGIAAVFGWLFGALFGERMIHAIGALLRERGSPG